MDILNEYLSQVQERRAVLFIGAGVSAIAGCRSWEEVREQLIEIKEINEIAQRGNKKPTTKEIITLAMMLSRTDGKRKHYESILRGSIRPEPNAYSMLYVPFIKTLKMIDPLPPIITTNIDSCLEDTGLFELDRSYYREDEMKQEYLSCGSIFHIHGYREHEGDQVWTLPDYSKRYSKPEFQRFIEHIYTHYTILFLGSSLNDDDLLKLFSAYSAESHEHSNIMHYALMPDDADKNSALFEKLYKITIVRYGESERFVGMMSAWIESHFASTSVVSGDPKLAPEV